MVWISMYRELLTHPKLRKFMRSSGLSRNEAAGTLFSVWAWGVDNAERNGMILEADRRDIADVISAGSGLSDGVKPSKVVDSMVESGWIDELDGHLYLHDWDEWQEMYYRFIDKREKDTARKRRAREAEKEAAGLPPPSPPAPPPPVPPPSSDEERAEEPRDKSKKVTKPKPEKKKYGDFVSMTEEEYGKLVSEYGQEAAKRMVEILNNYKGATGKPYKSDYLAILNWVVKRIKEESPTLIRPKPSETSASGHDGSPVPEEWRNFRRGEA